MATHLLINRKGKRNHPQLTMAKTAFINVELKAELGALIAATDPDYFKNARSFSKGVGMDAKFNKWLTTDVSKLGIKLFDDAEFRGQVLDSIDQWTSVKEKQAAVIAMMETSIESIIAAKDLEVTTANRGKIRLVLSEDQKAAHAKQLTKFATTVKRNANKALIELGLSLGVIIIDNTSAVEAPEQVLEVAQ